MKHEKKFIGRKIYQSRIRQEVLNNDFSIGISVVGLPSMGKTSTVLNALENCPENINLIYIDLSKYDDPIVFWKDVCNIVKDYLDKAGYVIPNLENRFKVINDPNARWIDFLINMNSIFNEVSNVGIKTIFILDEFDTTSDLFKGNASYFDILRSLILGKDLNISIICISQKPIWSIEKEAATSSSFYPMFDFIALRGFDINDLYEYYADLKENGIELSQNQKEQLHYYVGEIPYLLSIMRDLLLTKKEEGVDDFDIKELVEENGEEIEKYYDQLHDQLKSQEDLDKIIAVLKNEDVPESLKDELILLGYITDRNGSYFSFSPYFVDYLKKKYKF